MANRGIPGITGPLNGPPRPQVKVTPDMLRDIVCDKCGNYTFVPVFVLKRLPALVSEDGEEHIVQLPVVACNACGNIPNEFLMNIPFEKKNTDALSNTELKPSSDAPSPSGLVVDSGFSK